MEIKDLLKFVQLAGTHPAFPLEKIIELADSRLIIIQRQANIKEQWL